MLTRLQTKNFRKLRDNVFDFTKGLNVLRGANEAGKSTMLEAISYALFGVKACREPLEGIVTWGEDVKTMRVDLTFELEGVSYNLKRSKSGAEMRYGDGQSVVGQTEVTAFIGRLFGTAPQNIPNLVLSGQGDIRGALDKGPKAATELIEDLADFAVIDDVIKLIGEKLLTGSAAPFEEKIARLEPELETLDRALGEVPDLGAEEAALATAKAWIETHTERMTTFSAALLPVAELRDTCRSLLRRRESATVRHELLEGQTTEAAAEVAKMIASEPDTPDNDRAEEIRGLLADAERLERARAVQEEISRLPEPPAVWDEGLQSFNAETNRVKSRSMIVQKRLNELTAEAREKRAQRVAATACGICGKDVSAIPEVKAKNDAIEARLGEIAAEETTLKVELTELAGSLRDLESVYAEHSKIERLAAKYGDLCRADTATVPWRLSYAGPELPDGGRSGALRVELNDILQQERRVTVWKTQLKGAEITLGNRRIQLKEAADVMNDGAYVEAEAKLPGLEAECDRINKEYAASAMELQRCREQAAGLDSDIRAAKAAYETAKARVDGVRAQLGEAKLDLASVNRNNTLLKKVRAARPVIANKLWSRVLAAVSRYFSLMRGDESVVAKDGEGFKVNGKSIDGLSGSTKDILGLAIRLALVRTFLPHAPFLILDEPSAACDAQRTEQMMGFLVSVGFDQMLVVTHEDTSEQVAQALIEM